ncbi:MAG: molybdopterin-dependent oxidoreductase [Pseudomonadota bacterium]
MSDAHTVTTSCAYDCGARCLLHVEVEGGRIARIGTEKGPGFVLTACARGLSGRAVIEAPDRLRTPLLRRGPRGSGDFEPIGWGEALDLAAGRLRDTIQRRGPEAVLLVGYSGSEGALHDTFRTGRRFFDLLGGCTLVHGNTSLEGGRVACRMMLGHEHTGSTRDNLLHSRLILLWGWNPRVTRFRPYTWSFLKQARAAGARVIAVDPRRTPSAEGLDAEWIPIRPGTDAALMLAMAWVMLDEGLHDRAFLEAHTAGFEPFAAYVRGEDDGQPKTPAWAAPLTGVPVAQIVALARAYATAKPAALCTGWAPGRSAFGEQFHRVAITLSAMTGNLGVLGGHVGGGVDRMPLGALAATLPLPGPGVPSVHVTQVSDALLRGRAGGHPTDIELLYVVGSNLLNQFPDTNRGAAALQRPAFTVVHDLFMTPTARYADLVLPVTHALERDDLAPPWIGGPYLIAANKAVEPPPGVRSDLAIFAALAERLGVAGYSDTDEQGWLRRFLDATPGLPSYDELRAHGVYRMPLDGPRVAFREQVEHGAPWPTPSGRIEIHAPALAALGDPLQPALPSWLPPWEGPGDPLALRFPLQLVTPHARTRVNSQLDNIPSLKRQADDRLWLHPRDAAARGLADGDRVRVFNDRGALRTRVQVTDGILPGVVSLDAGAWYRPGPDGVDDGGCVNVLTRAQPSPAGATPCNTALVEVVAEPA